jgi:hypothetical protein
MGPRTSQDVAEKRKIRPGGNSNPVVATHSQSHYCLIKLFTAKAAVLAYLSNLMKQRLYVAYVLKVNILEWTLALGCHICHEL